MNEVRQVLRYVLPGLLSIIQLLICLIVTDRDLISEIFKSNEYAKNFGAALTIVKLEFNVPHSKKHKMLRWTWGEPFMCCIMILDDLGKKYIYEGYGWCGQHDPDREHRSTRRYAF